MCRNSRTYLMLKNWKMYIEHSIQFKIIQQQPIELNNELLNSQTLFYTKNLKQCINSTKRCLDCKKRIGLIFIRFLKMQFKLFEWVSFVRLFRAYVN